MSNNLIDTILSSDDSLRNRSINSLLLGKNSDELLNTAKALEEFRKSSDNLYNKVRASLFLFVIYRHYLAKSRDVKLHGEIPFEGVQAAFERDFEKSLDVYFQSGMQNSAVFSAIADSYYQLSFKYLLDQVKLSISKCSENYSLYHINRLDDYPFRVPAELTTPDKETGFYPVGMDATPVRLDPSHSGWSDIFFLGMDFPEGARVVNMSVNLSVHGSNKDVGPPCECYCRYIEEPVIILKSIDLDASKTISDLAELFNFANDYLSLLKAGVVSSGIVPPCFEEKNIPLRDILQTLLGKPGGIEIVTRVNGIPKGSRLAVSTTLLATIITRLMRFSGQIRNQTGPILEEERRVAASRAILGEWLGGSGGGWQDSGGLWPGIKIIQGAIADHGDPEYGISRGCLLPTHNIFTRDIISHETEEKILNSIVLIHGGISQDVGPILEMVTEKYLLKYEKEWEARQRGIELFDEIADALKAGDMKQLGKLTTLDWDEAIQPIIPWVNNAFTQELLLKLRSEFKEHYWGFLMLGGMSGGGMALIINPEIKEHFKIRVGDIMKGLRNIYASSFPFIIDPVVIIR
jgi:galactokinase/mevalonate kinase-like predicted kinase